MFYQKVKRKININMIIDIIFFRTEPKGCETTEFLQLGQFWTEQEKEW